MMSYCKILNKNLSYDDIVIRYMKNHPKCLDCSNDELMTAYNEILAEIKQIKKVKNITVSFVKQTWEDLVEKYIMNVNLTENAQRDDILDIDFGLMDKMSFMYETLFKRGTSTLLTEAIDTDAEKNPRTSAPQSSSSKKISPHPPSSSHNYKAANRMNTDFRPIVEKFKTLTDNFKTTIVNSKESKTENLEKLLDEQFLRMDEDQKLAYFLECRKVVEKYKNMPD